MATITGSQQAKTYALANRMRAGATRAGYTSGAAVVTINGTQYGAGRPVDANQVLGESLSITEVLNQTPNTAAFTMKGFEPSEGADVVIKFGSINNSERLFAGTIINRSHAYVGTPANWTAPVNAIDYTWQLTRRLVSGSFTTVDPAVVAAAIVAAVPGFTLSVPAGLPTLDAISYTDIDALAALTQLAGRIGGYCDVDYNKVVKLFITDTSTTAPTPLTPSHPTLTAFSWTRDLSRVVTRVFVEGGGVNALTAVAPGETILPVESTVWYNPAGGTVKAGTQHIAYTGTYAGGSGSLIGLGASPSTAPVLALVAGTGIGTGVYRYAYTDVTASGESNPSPLGTVTTGTVPTFLAPQSAAPTFSTLSGGSGVAPGTYDYAVTNVNGAGETTPGPRLTYVVTLGAQNPVFHIPLGPSGTVSRRVWRTTAGGSQLKLHPAGGLPNNTGTTYADNSPDSALGVNAPTTNTATTGTTTATQVAVSGIAIGPSPTTGRNVYRTEVNASQLKLHTTIANNTATTIATDTIPDGSLGANAPTSDTSGISFSGGQVNAGSTSLLTASAAPFVSTGGWALLGGGQVIRYTGISANSLTGIPAVGIGALLTTVLYGQQVVAAPALTGIPASGGGSIVSAIKQGDPINLLVQVDDLAAQAALVTLIGGSDDGIIEAFIQEGTIGETEARARGLAKLAQSSMVQISISATVRDKNAHAGRLIHVDMPSPTNLTGDFMIQQVTIDTFQPALMATFHIQASSDQFSLEDLLRFFRQKAA